MIVFSDLFLPAASINTPYDQYLNVTGGVAPYSFALVSGSLPPGLTLSAAGRISGQATTIGSYQFGIQVVDSTVPTQQTRTQTFTFTVLDIITLADATVDQGQFVAQFQSVLSTTQTWSTSLTTETSQTMIELVSAIGTFATSRIVRAREDSFPETAQSDSAIRAIATMQGLRLTRMLPAAANVTVQSATAQIIPPYTQFSGGGYNWFNSQPITLQPNVAVTATLKEGQVVSETITGLGSDLQAWVSEDDAFTVSDQDVVVSINGSDLYKTFGTLWNYQGIAAYADQTLNDGRMMIQFGSQGYGAIPGVNDRVNIKYAKTQGSTINGANLAGNRLTCSTFPSITASFASNPSGGADTKSVVAYKNFAAGSFGTFSSGVTKAQYQSLVNNYPGIIDATTQAQREINPSDVKWMNVIRVSALTSSPWTQQQINDFISYMQSVTMYAPRFIWQEPVAVPRTINIEIYCFNAVSSLGDVQNKVQTAIQTLISKRPGILMTDLYPTDLDSVAKNAAPGQISYTIINSPTAPMTVSAPVSPQILYQIQNSAGTLPPLLYSYSIAVDAPSPSKDYVGMIDASTNPPYPTPSRADQYWIIKIAGTCGGITVGVGDQVLATSLITFVVIPAASNGVIDHGVPSNWVNPEVTQSNAAIRLDWSANPVENALQYNIWGRRAGFIGILATVPASQLSYIDSGGPDPTPQPVATAADTLIRYNSIDTLTVSAFYAKRQTDVNLPIRDSLN